MAGPHLPVRPGPRQLRAEQGVLRPAPAVPELDPHSLWRLQGLLPDCDAAERRVRQLDRRVEDVLAADHRRQLDLLETVPGIGRTSAHAILAEIGPDLARTFPTAQHLASWTGICPGNNESAGKRRSGRTRRGNETLKVTLTECAHAAARTLGSQFDGCHGALTRRIGYRKAVTATAHKLLRIVYAVLRDDQPYRDPNVDYERLFVKRNAPRWLRMLKKHRFLQELQ